MLKMLMRHNLFFKTPSNLNFFWNFGMMGSIFLINQIVTGMMLAMYYIPNIEYAFSSIIFIMQEIKYGWFVRYLHLNGASFFFLVMYMHLARNLYYKSFVYPSQYLWLTGGLLLILMIVVAFLGYVLPWGQMSFWAATVITNLFTTIPYVGFNLVEWLWSGFSLNNVTLNKFFSLHYFLPFVLYFIFMLHVILLHEFGSTNVLGLPWKSDNMFFFPNYAVKDIVGFFVVLWLFLLFVFFYPEVLNHTDNYMKANSLVTPEHMVPEWYFLPFYAMLRSVPNKGFGVMLLMNSLLTLIMVPYYMSFMKKMGSMNYLYSILMFFMFLNAMWLMYLGQCQMMFPYYEISQLCTFLYFFLFIMLINLVKLINKMSSN